MDPLHKNLKINGPKKGEAEISAEIPWENLAGYVEAEMENVRANFEAPGFRKGNVPMEILKQHVREDHVLEDAVQEALQDAYPAIIEESKLVTLGRPEISLTKLAKGNPAEFKIRVGVKPDVKLPNYQKIAEKIKKEAKPVEVSVEELENFIKMLIQARGVESLTEENVKTLGDFQSIEDFKKQLRENLQMEKEAEAKRARRENLAAALIAESKLEIPEMVLKQEEETMFTRLLEDLERANLKLEDYLKKANKTEEDLRKEEREYSERQLKTRFLLEAIAEAEKIEPDAKELEAESALMQKRYPDLAPERIEEYISAVIRNEKVLELLAD